MFMIGMIVGFTLGSLAGTFCMALVQAGTRRKEEI